MPEFMKLVEPLTDAEKVVQLTRENKDLKRELDSEYQRGYFDALAKFGLE